ncbi:MAG: tetratricopeptide repeat protein [Phyllobacterium sp.]|uniref:TPR end-of-group domain-containing protein n=1 Tax=Phyllobacterium sp. TaxID=1871046 RepID=UPI0030F07084
MCRCRLAIGIPRGTLLVERKLTAILAADVARYSALMEADEAATFERLRSDRKELFEPEIKKHHGRIFKVMGDGLLAEFGSVVDAVECAVTLQRGLAERNARVGEAIEVRIGINLGEVIVEGRDRYGEGVNIAARLQELAEPGGICVSGKVSKEIEKKLPIRLEPMGEKRMKNITEPVACYRINLEAFPRTQLDRSLPNLDRRSDRTSIAVLPFNNMSGDPEQEYFSDGITEDIITDLSKISGLQVVARNTVFTYKDKPILAQQAAAELGVKFLLEGSVRKAGSRVRVTGQLIDGKNGSHVWADRYDRELTDIFAIQDEITQAIVNQLKVKLLPEEQKAIQAAPPTANVEAYAFYLRGRQFSHMCSKSYVQMARRMFTRAAELDPGYARAYSGIADCDSILHSWHHVEVSIEGILAMSAKALALDPKLAEAHASRGLALQFGGRHEEAAAEFEQALSLDPNLYEANYFYARFFNAQGDFEQAAKLFERATEIRSTDYRSPVLLTAVYRSLGREEDRIRAARLGLERAEHELNLHPENSGPAQLGALALAHLGERDRAKEWAARAIAIDPDDLLALYNIACTYSQLGEIEMAIDVLEKVLPHASAEQILWFSKDSDLDPLRSHTRFQKLFERSTTP